MIADALSVIVPVAVLDAKYPGGAEQYGRDCPNQTFCEDGTITRVGFMVSADMDRHIARLMVHGMVCVADDQYHEIAVVDQFRGLLRPCRWLDGAQHWDGFAMVWHRAVGPSPMAAPFGWKPSDSRSLIRLENDEVPKRLLKLGETGDVETMLDYETGREGHIGRVRG